MPLPNPAPRARRERTPLGNARMSPAPNASRPSDDLRPSLRPDFHSLFWFLAFLAMFLAWVFDPGGCR